MSNTDDFSHLGLWPCPEYFCLANWLSWLEKIKHWEEIHWPNHGLPQGAVRKDNGEEEVQDVDGHKKKVQFFSWRRNEDDDDLIDGSDAYLRF